MTAREPSPPGMEDDRRSSPGLSARERELQLQIDALRQENERLRKRLGSSAEENMGPLRAVNRYQAADDPARDDLIEYRALFDALSHVFPIGVFRTQADGSLSHLDQSLAEMFDLPAEEFVEFGWMKRVHPEDLPLVQAQWEQGITAGNSLSVEFRLLMPNGQLRHLLVRNFPQRDAQGQLRATLGFVQDVTLLRSLKADADLKNNLSQQIIANSPDCHKLLDLEGRLQLITEQGRQLVELDEAERIEGQDWVSWWPAENQASVREALERARGGERVRLILFGQTFKGTPKWWDNIISPITDNRGRPTMLLVVSRDITEQRRQEQAILELNTELEQRVQARTTELASANEQLTRTLRDASSLYNQAPCGYHSLNAQGFIEQINQTELDWLGFEREEVVGRLHFSELVDAVDLGTQNERLQQLIGGQPVAPMEMCLVGKNGRRRDVLVSTTAVYDAQGKFVCTNSTLLDISARKAAEQALHAQSLLLQRVSDAMPVQVALFDRDLICRFANASYARWMNTSPEQLVGLHLNQIARPQDYAANVDRLQVALTGQSQSFEGERQFPDGPVFYADITYTPYTVDEQVQGLIIQIVDVTQRKAAEDRLVAVNAQLQEAAVRWQSLYNDAPCGYHSVDANGIFVSINDTELQWLGYDREEVVGRMNQQDLVATGYSREPVDRLRLLMEKGQLEPTEYLVRRRDGSTFHALVTSSAVFDVQGRFVQTNSTMVDISQRKAAEAALREQQHLLQTVADHMPGLVAYLDEHLAYRFANIEYRRFYGLDPSTVVGRRARDVLPPTIWNQVARPLEAALRGQAQHFEDWRQTASGERIFVQSNYLPDRRSDGIQGVFVQVIDITDRKKVEDQVLHINEELERKVGERSAELLESEQRFRLLVDNLREYCIYFMDPQGHLTDWTDSAQRMEGYTPTEVLGRHVSVVLDPDDDPLTREQAEHMLRRAASRGQVERNSWHRRKDGSAYWCASVLIALRDDAGELLGYAMVNRDMTDAKRLEDLMRNINEELENRVTERTAQLTAANKDLESFSYSVSHDLRSPLRHISSFVTLLEEHLDQQLDNEARKYLGTIASSTRHMSQLIDALLHFSRTGRAAISPSPVDFGLLVEAVVQQIDHEQPNRIVDWVIPTDLPVVQCDAVLMREVWTNLLGNAHKYTRPRERSRIEVSWSVDPAVGYSFHVRDNGVGFDTKYAQKLFGVFQRLHRASEFEGTGIGLALTRRIIERHGGSIWADSQVGTGSTFSFNLPFDGILTDDLGRDTIPSALD